MPKKIEQIEREQQEYRQLKIGIEKKLQDIQNSLGNVGNIFDQSDQSTYQNQNPEEVNREYLDLKKNFKDTSPKSDFVGTKELKKKAMDSRVAKTEQNSMANIAGAGFKSSVIRESNLQYGVSPKNNSSESNHSAVAKETFKKRTETMYLNDQIKKIKKAPKDYQSNPTGMIQLCDFITTTYQVYLDNCFKNLQ